MNNKDYLNSLLYDDNPIYKWSTKIAKIFTLDDVTDKYDLEEIINHIGIEDIERFIRKQKLDKLIKITE